jgi:hypothetical protein
MFGLDGRSVTDYLENARSRRARERDGRITDELFKKRLAAAVRERATRCKLKVERPERGGLLHWLADVLDVELGKTMVDSPWLR